MKSLDTIAVDLTPVLAGGENGGAKIFVLELLRGLAQLAPSTNFVLLTRASANDELASLDRANIRRVIAVGASVHDSWRSRVLSVAKNRLTILPRRLRVLLTRLGHAVDVAVKRGATASLLRTIDADLLFCPFTAPTYFEPGIPTVCTIYDLQYKTHPDFFSPEDATQRDRAFVDACRRGAALVAISDYSRDSAIVHGNLDPSRIRTIYLRMARRISGGAALDEGFRAIPGLERRRYLIYPANFWLHKNHEMLITAFGMACHQGLPADIRLVCTGAPGARQAWLKEAAARLGLGERILFPGFVPDDRLASLVAHAAGMVFPSLYEGFGLPVIEAMAAGVPVACSNTTSLPEVANDAAIFFDPRVPAGIASALIKLVEGGSATAPLVEAGLARAAEFSSSDRMAREYWEVFQTAMHNRIEDSHLTGAFRDGWAGPSITVQVGSGLGTQTLELEFSAPAWLPQGTVTISGRCRGGKPGPAVKLAPGHRARWSMTVPPGAVCEVRLGPTFIPAQAGIGDDQRVLSAMLASCVLTQIDGHVVDLVAEAVAA